jgi:hypothetical protein
MLPDPIVGESSGVRCFRTPSHHGLTPKKMSLCSTWAGAKGVFANANGVRERIPYLIHQKGFRMIPVVPVWS